MCAWSQNRIERFGCAIAAADKRERLEQRRFIRATAAVLVPALTLAMEEASIPRRRLVK